MFNVETIRKDFPILSRKVNGKPLVYFDNAATSQTPQQVIDVIVDYYSNYNANIHKSLLAYQLILRFYALDYKILMKGSLNPSEVLK